MVPSWLRGKESCSCPALGTLGSSYAGYWALLGTVGVAAGTQRGNLLAASPDHSCHTWSEVPRTTPLRSLYFQPAIMMQLQLQTMYCSSISGWIRLWQILRKTMKGIDFTRGFYIARKYQKHLKGIKMHQVVKWRKSKEKVERDGRSRDMHLGTFTNQAKDTSSPVFKVLNSPSVCHSSILQSHQHYMLTFP